MKVIRTGRISEKKKSEQGALAVQVGGGHYKDLAIQPVEYVTKNKMGFIEGNVIKYVTRFRNKAGIQDLRKAKHFIDLLIELEYGDVLAAEKAAEEKAKKKATAKKKTYRPTAMFKTFKVTAALGEVIGHQDTTRTEAVKRVWAYVKKHNLQDQKNKRNINCDEKLAKAMSGKKVVNMFEMAKLIGDNLK